MLPGVVVVPPPDVFLEALNQRPRITRGLYTLEADTVTLDPTAEVTHLKGRVVVTYQNPPVDGRAIKPTRITCEDAVVDNVKEEARFSEGVTLEDEIGTLHANELFISYKRPGSGYAKGIVLDAYEAHFEGEEITFEEGAYRLKNAWFTTCLQHYRVLLTDIVIRPGKFISAQRSGFQLFGFTIPVPFFRVGLNPRETGLQSPVPSVDEDFQWGYRWRNVLDFGHGTSVLIDEAGGQNRVPTFNGQLYYSVSSPHSRSNIIAPRVVDRERFTDGYMNSVVVPDQGKEEADIGAAPSMLFIGRTTNALTRTRPGTPVALDRPWYVGFDGSAMMGATALAGQIRYGKVGERLAADSSGRLEFYGTALSPGIPLPGRLSARLRSDVALISGATSYGWIRPELVLSFEASDKLRLSAAFVKAFDWGTASFDNDRLHSTTAAHFRADLKYPNTDLSVLIKYDFDKRDLYDIEFAIGQVADCIRPFVSYRKFPGTFAIGFTLRADNLFAALKRRTPTRQGTP
jgi:hypothetical protein